MSKYICFLCLKKGFVLYETGLGHMAGARCRCKTGKKKYGGLPVIDEVMSLTEISNLETQNRTKIYGEGLF